jgi:hypothetical protein
MAWTGSSFASDLLCSLPCGVTGPFQRQVHRPNEFSPPSQLILSQKQRARLGGYARHPATPHKSLQTNPHLPGGPALPGDGHIAAIRLFQSD